MTLPLHQFQDLFIQALLARDPKSIIPLQTLTSQAGFSVYRNTVTKGCIDALEANYPSVLRLVGQEWFRAACAMYMRTNMPQNPSLIHYGENFPAFLKDFAPAAELPYLSDVAQIDHCWNQAYTALKHPILDPAILQKMPPETLATTILVVHPAAHWRWFPDSPIYSIWHNNRTSTVEQKEIAWHGEGILITRPHNTVSWHETNAATCAFLDACKAGETLIQASAQALSVQTDINIAALLADLLMQGAFYKTSCNTM